MLDILLGATMLLHDLQGFLKSQLRRFGELVDSHARAPCLLAGSLWLRCHISWPDRLEKLLKRSAGDAHYTACFYRAEPAFIDPVVYGLASHL
jgi:hypothetical protein